MVRKGFYEVPQLMTEGRSTKEIAGVIRFFYPIPQLRRDITRVLRAVRSDCSPYITEEKAGYLRRGYRAMESFGLQTSAESVR